MAAPTLQASGTIANVTTGNLTVTLPTHQADDILIVVVSGWVPNTTTGTNVMTAPAGGWAKLLSDSLITSTIIDGEWAIFWLRATASGTTNPTFTRPASWDTGTDTAWGGCAYVIRGCTKTGNPWDDAQKSALHAAANGALPAVTVSGTERTVIHFLSKSDDNGAVTAATGWTLDTAVASTTGTDCSFQTIRKNNVSASTTADATTIVAPLTGLRYQFYGISFKPDPPTTITPVESVSSTVSDTAQLSVVEAVFVYPKPIGGRGGGVSSGGFTPTPAPTFGWVEVIDDDPEVGQPSSDFIQATIGEAELSAREYATDGNNFTALPADFGTATAIKVYMYSSITGAVDDIPSIGVRILASNDSTILAQPSSQPAVWTGNHNGLSTVDLVLTPTLLAYTKNDWDTGGARLHIYQSSVKSGGADTMIATIYAVKLLVTYNKLAPPTTITPVESTSTTVSDVAQLTIINPPITINPVETVSTTVSDVAQLTIIPAPTTITPIESTSASVSDVAGIISPGTPLGVTNLAGNPGSSGQVVLTWSAPTGVQ